MHLVDTLVYAVAVCRNVTVTSLQTAIFWVCFWSVDLYWQYFFHFEKKMAATVIGMFKNAIFMQFVSPQMRVQSSYI